MSLAAEIDSNAGSNNLHDIPRERVVIVGGGMAGFGLCERLVSSGTIQRLSVTVLGDEPQPAYDRVNLSKLFQGRTADDLLLAKPSWYAEHKIKLHTGRRIVRIDRKSKIVVDDQGASHVYDRLVLATGSYAYVPPIPGADLPGVFVYRTMNDLLSIQQYVDCTRARAGIVIGGGLLGLEAAKVLFDLGLHTSVVEMAPGLMPRQLDATAAKLLREKVEEIGVEVHTVRRTERFEKTADGIRVRFGNASAYDVDVVVVAAGVRPRDELAKSAGLLIGARGGIVVNQQLVTSDSNIHAIGECASYRDYVYGLVAPCYRMADVLAQVIAGDDARFNGADESAELKLLGVKVAALGKAIGQTSGVVMTHQSEKGYRKLLLEQGRVVGAACVGDWDELPMLRQAINKQTRLWPTQRTRFRRFGTPWAAGGMLSPIDWPDDAVICSCHAVTRGAISNAISGGCATLEQLAVATGASTACGGCRGLVCELAGASRETIAVPWTNALTGVSVLTLVVALSFVLMTPMPIAQSVQAGWRNVDILWRDDVARQATGFSTLGLMAASMIFSLRKRVPRFSQGSYGFWRALHGLLGVAMLVGVGVHTGMRLGENMNFVLGIVVLAVTMVGALAGIVSSLEFKVNGTLLMRVRWWRPVITKLHFWITWPLPVLIAFHILSFYWFGT